MKMSCKKDIQKQSSQNLKTADSLGLVERKCINSHAALYQLKL